MSDRFVTVAQRLTAPESMVLQARLESEGIRCLLNNNEVVNTLWHYSIALGGIRLDVAEPDLPRAQEILAEHAEDQLDDAELIAEAAATSDEEAADVALSEANADIDDLYPPTRGMLARRAFLAAMLGLVLFPLQLYATWALLRIAQEREQLSPADRWAAGIALVLNLSFYAVLAFFTIAWWRNV